MDYLITLIDVGLIISERILKIYIVVCMKIQSMKKSDEILKN